MRCGGIMNQDDKLKKICNDFSLLNEEQQNYILGILQALVFAKTNSNSTDNSQTAISQEESERTEETNS